MSSAIDPIATPPALPPRRRLRLRWLFGLLLLLAGGAALVIFARGDPGYVLISIGQFSLETSIWLALAAMLLGYLAARLLGAAWRAAFGARGWLRQRRVRQAKKRTTEGLLAFLHGDHATARKQLLASVTAADSPELNLMFAARAAHAEGDRAGAETYLRQAETRLRADQPAASLMRLEQALEAGAEPPISELQALRTRAPRNPGVLRALAVALERGQQWQALRALVPELRAQQVFLAPALAELERRAWRGATRAARSVEALKAHWGELSRAERDDGARVLAYALALHRFGADIDAEPVVREALNSEWQHQLVTLYGLLRADIEKQTRQAEQWLAQHPDDGALLQSLGRLRAAAEQWVEARNSFQAALNVLTRKGSDNWGPPSQRCTLELVEAMLRTGDADGALAQLRAAPQ